MSASAATDCEVLTPDERTIDPNTGEPIDGKPDFGHKKWNEFWRENGMQEEGLTQKEFNERMNDPRKHQLEEPPPTGVTDMRRPKEPEPVHDAVMRHSVSEVAEAIAKGADVDELDRERRTSLFYAVRDGDLAVAVDLIRCGANVNIQDRNLETPLHFAARSYRPEIAELLLKHGARVETQDDHGNSPLLRAVFDSKSRGDVIKVLLAHGADKTLRTIMVSRR